jgi:hypothetical protein
MTNNQEQEYHYFCHFFHATKADFAYEFDDGYAGNDNIYR